MRIQLLNRKNQKPHWRVLTKVKILSSLIWIGCLLAACLTPSRPDPTGVVPPTDSTAQETETMLPTLECQTTTALPSTRTPTLPLKPDPPITSVLTCTFPLRGDIVFFSARGDTNQDGRIDHYDKMKHYIMNAASTDQCQVPGLQYSRGSVVHPYEPRIALLEEVEGVLRLTILDTQSGETQVFISGLEENVRPPMWSPDGQWIVLESREYLHIVQVDPREDRAHYRIPITDIQSVSFFVSITSNYWSPDSRHLVLVGKSETSENLAVYQVNRDGSGLSMVAEVPALAYNPSVLGAVHWSSDGSQILFTSYHRWLETILQADPDSGLALARPFELYAVDLATGDLSRLTDIATHGEIWWPRWSPDGQTILYSWMMQEEPFEGPELWLMDGDGSNPRRLSEIPVLHGFGRWSSDGEWIVFYTGWDPVSETWFIEDDPLNTEIFVVRPDGRDLRRLTNNRFPDRSPVWLP